MGPRTVQGEMSAIDAPHCSLGCSRVVEGLFVVCARHDQSEWQHVHAWCSIICAEGWAGGRVVFD